MIFSFMCMFCRSVFVSDSTHHFFRNACTKSGSLRFSQFSVVDWFCLFIYIWVLTFPLEDCSEFGNFFITLICPFSFGHCLVCSSSIYGFWLPLWYLQTLLFYEMNIRNIEVKYFIKIDKYTWHLMSFITLIQ